MTVTRPYDGSTLIPMCSSPATEQALKPGEFVQECAKDCPEMIVVPAGEFTMGSPATEQGRYQ